MAAAAPPPPSGAAVEGPQPPSWKDRLIPPLYTSPSGATISFIYEDVEERFRKHTFGFNFSRTPGTFVQDLSYGGRRFPMLIFFTGDHHDLQADLFSAMLRETGIGTLDHPRYGAGIKVIPFGEISRRDELKTAGNQAVFRLTFWETTGLLYPLATDSPEQNTRDAVAAFEAAIPIEFADFVEPGIVKEVPKQTMLDELEGAVGVVKSGLAAVVQKVEEVKREFDRIARAIQNGIDTFVGGPLLLATQVVKLAQLPARLLSNINAQLSGYSNVLTGIIDEVPAISRVSIAGVSDPNPSNKFRVDDLAASNAVIGAVQSALNATFEQRNEAVQAANQVLAMCDALTAWREDRIETLELIDTGESYSHLLNACALVAGHLVEISFSLKQERSITLDEPHTLIDLAAKLYGKIDDETLDFLISSNSLGHEIFEMSAGRKIAYYI